MFWASARGNVFAGIGENIVNCAGINAHDQNETIPSRVGINAHAEKKRTLKRPHSVPYSPIPEKKSKIFHFFLEKIISAP